VNECKPLPEGFPKQPPICYVQPTASMIIKPAHRLVDGSGRAPQVDSMRTRVESAYSYGFSA